MGIGRGLAASVASRLSAKTSVLQEGGVTLEVVECGFVEKFREVILPKLCHGGTHIYAIVADAAVTPPKLRLHLGNSSSEGTSQAFKYLGNTNDAMGRVSIFGQPKSSLASLVWAVMGNADLREMVYATEALRKLKERSSSATLAITTGDIDIVLFSQIMAEEHGDMIIRLIVPGRPIIHFTVKEAFEVLQRESSLKWDELMVLNSEYFATIVPKDTNLAAAISQSQRR